MDWKSLAKHRHSPSVLAGAAAVLGLPYLMQEPQMMHYGAAAVLASGVVAGLIEAGRWAWQKLS